MDGVLTKSMDSHIQAWKIAFNEFKIFPTKKELALMEGMPSHKIISNLSKKYSKKLTKKQKESLYEIKKQKTIEFYNLEIYPEIKLIIKFLKNKKIKLGVVTGANKEFAKKIIEKKFKNSFNTIITGSDVKIGKPSPEPYLMAIKKLKTNPQKILVIENAPLGIKSSTKAKLMTYALETTLNKKYLQNAKEIFKSHKELLKKLKRIIN